VIEDIAVQYKGKLIVGKVDVDQNAELGSRFQIQGIPDFILFKEGQPVENIVGMHPKEDLTKIIDKYLQQ
jgi:thioredoxin 1